MNSSGSYFREPLRENEGFSTCSIAFGISSIGLGVVGHGVRDIAYVSLTLGAMGILLGILALADKRQRKKGYAMVAMVLCPAGIAVAVHAIWPITFVV